MREKRNHVLTPEERENRTKDSPNANANPATSHAQDVRQYSTTPSESSLQRMDSSYRSRGYGSSALYLRDTNESVDNVGSYYGRSNKELDKPVPVQPLPMERHTGDGPRMRVIDDEPQMAQWVQAKRSPKRDATMPPPAEPCCIVFSPHDSYASKPQDRDRREKLPVNAVDARPLPVPDLSTSISSRT